MSAKPTSGELEMAIAIDEPLTFRENRSDGNFRRLPFGGLLQRALIIILRQWRAICGSSPARTI